MDNEQPRIDIYIDQIMTVTGVEILPDSPLPHYLMLILKWEMPNNWYRSLSRYRGDPCKNGIKVIPGDEDAKLKRMTLQPSFFQNCLN